MATAKTEFITVNGEQVKLTRAYALEQAVAALKQVGADAKVIANVQHQLDGLTAKRSTGEPSEKAIANAKLAQTLMGVVAERHLPSLTLVQVANILKLERTDGKPNTAKARAVITPLINSHQLQKVEKSEPAEYLVLLQ